MNAPSAVATMGSASVLRGLRNVLNCHHLAGSPRFHKESAVRFVLVSSVLQLKVFIKQVFAIF